jgi:spore maturation protein CgeB
VSSALSKITLVQTRASTPNNYLFQDFSEALEKSKPLHDVYSAVSGLDSPKYFSDFILFFGGEELRTPLNIAHLKYAKKRIVWFTEDPYEQAVNLKNESLFDLVLSTDQQSSKNYLTQSKYFPLAAPENLFQNAKNIEKKYDIFLFGSLWPNRIDLLEELVANLKNTQFRILLLTSQNDQDWINQDRIFKLFFEIEKYKGRVMFITRPFSLKKINELAQICKVCVNWPRLFENDQWSVPGPRIFEIAASTTPQLIDIGAQPDVLQLVPSDSYISYRTSNINEVLTKLINDDEIIAQTGNKMFDFVSTNHTWRVRVLEFLEILDKKLTV